MVIFIGMCLVGVGVITHSDWKFDDNDEYLSDKYLSDESISAATALLSTTPANGISHSSKNPTLSVRQRVRFKPSESECQHSQHQHRHEHM